MVLKIYTDGGARGNPGPGAVGVVLLNSKKEIIYELAKYIGKCTNNEAEYSGVIHGLEAAIEKNAKSADMYIDSELVVKQLNGDYKVKNERLREMHTLVKNLEAKLTKVTYTHVKRDKNKRADALVNEALDQNGY